MAGKRLEPLSEAQQEIMQIVWDRGELSATEVREALAPRRKVARTTVHTLMTRMVEKGWLKARSVGRTFLFSATVPQSTSLGRSVRDFVDSVFGGSAEEMMSSLLEHRGLSAEEAKRIMQMIERAEHNDTKRKGR